MIKRIGLACAALCRKQGFVAYSKNMLNLDSNASAQNVEHYYSKTSIRLIGNMPGFIRLPAMFIVAIASQGAYTQTVDLISNISADKPVITPNEQMVFTKFTADYIFRSFIGDTISAHVMNRLSGQLPHHKPIIRAITALQQTYGINRTIIGVL